MGFSRDLGIPRCCFWRLFRRERFLITESKTLRKEKVARGGGGKLHLIGWEEPQDVCH